MVDPTMMHNRSISWQIGDWFRNLPRVSYNHKPCHVFGSCGVCYAPKAGNSNGIRNQVVSTYVPSQSLERVDIKLGEPNRTNVISIGDNFMVFADILLCLLLATRAVSTIVLTCSCDTLG